MLSCTFLIVNDSISASKRVCFIANIADRRDVDTMFNEGIYMWVLKIVTDSQTDSLNKYMVVYHSYSYSFWVPDISYSMSRHVITNIFTKLLLDLCSFS